MSASDQDLFETVEEIRKRSFPTLPAELVRQIITIEKEFTENRQEAYRRISEALDAYLANPLL